MHTCHWQRPQTSLHICHYIHVNGLQTLTVHKYDIEYFLEKKICQGKSERDALAREQGGLDFALGLQGPEGDDKQAIVSLQCHELVLHFAQVLYRFVYMCMYAFLFYIHVYYACMHVCMYACMYTQTHTYE